MLYLLQHYTLTHLPRVQGHKLLIFVTTSNRPLLDSMGITDCFSSSLFVENISESDQVSIDTL